MFSRKTFKKTRLRNAAVLSAAIVLTLTGTVVAGAVDSDNTAPTMAHWAVPPLKSNTPQTAEQAEYSRQNGRAKPNPELLQPTLDPALHEFQPARNKSELRGDFKCASSDVLTELSKNWIAEFKRYYPNVNISVDPPYAGSLGAVELINGNLDCAFVSRELKPTDVKSFRDAYGYDPTSVPISGGSYRQFGWLDSLAFTVNKKNPMDKLSLDQLDSILSTTRARGGDPITTWGDLGLTGEWADKPIRIYGIAPWNGYEEFIRQRVLSTKDVRGEWRSPETDPNVHWEKTVFKLAQQVAADPYAIGYTGNAYIDAPVKVLSLSHHTGDPVYAPTYENVASAAYPLSRLAYLNMNKKPDAPLNPVFAELTRFILSKQGQQVIRDQGIFLPLRGFQADSSYPIAGITADTPPPTP
ncbi:substrate-binding domain-containing protein [Streptomyces sp. NPDC049597]|uniref:PstS family phosphate ABC transporter substrate-binding protein n=1 Tax=Streptomyces sp. NPDC049597 TaxID=3155276 RepID=UPI00341FF7EA